MPDVVVVCADTDRRLADRLSTALRKEQFQAFVASGERNIRCDERLSAAINQASSIVVLWTPSALEDNAVLYQARTADIRNALVSLSVDGCTPPTEFDNNSTTDLSRWVRDGSRSTLASVVDIVRTRADQAPGEGREDFLRS
ncbi:MAG: TIR domain-containing protein, partial [Hyphomicrobiaceae bacterium]